jgi:hypothetical protein
MYLHHQAMVPIHRPRTVPSLHRYLKEAGAEGLQKLQSLQLCVVFDTLVLLQNVII